MLPSLLASALLLSPVQSSDADEIGRAFISEVMEGRDFEAAEFLVSEDLFFIDPTAAAMGCSAPARSSTAMRHTRILPTTTSSAAA